MHPMDLLETKMRPSFGITTVGTHLDLPWGMPLHHAVLALLMCTASAAEPTSPAPMCSFPGPVESSLTSFPACFDEGSAARGGACSTSDRPSMAALEAPVSWARGRTKTYIPTGFTGAGDTYDLVVHFHGVDTRVQSAFQASGFEHAVLVSVNLGNGSGPYEDRFAMPGSFAQLLEGLQRAIEQHAPMRSLRLGRVGLSAWSAGYGAIKQILSQQANRERVDAVLLADGLHAGFTDPRTRTIHGPRLAPFVAFAQDAARGEKLMAVAHSAIQTTTYASTTETAAYLTHAVGLAAHPARGEHVGGLELTSSVHEKGFRVDGYEGNDTEAHVDHLANIDDTLLSQLRAWWSKDRS